MTYKNYKKLIIKVGSNVLTRADGLPDTERMRHLVDQIADIHHKGIEVILVSSGAVASGRSMVKLPEKYDTVAKRQVLASVGQVKLIQTYADLFKNHDLNCAQVLVTKEDFRDRLHYLNMKNCFTALLQNGIIPIVNENDVISVTELMFTDNDELSGLVASMMNVDALIILSNVNGIYNGSPSDPASQVIPLIEPVTTSFSGFISSEKSNFGRGGMLTKCNIASKVAQLGIAVHIANGKTDHVLTNLMQYDGIGTLFLPQKNTSNIKKWVAHSEGFVKGRIYINEGAKKALVAAKASSLLPVGVTRIEGSFEKGDIIKILDENENDIGLGMAQYGSDKASERKGEKNHKPLVHYDYLFLY